jgi:hypothetical protein
MSKIVWDKQGLNKIDSAMEKALKASADTLQNEIRNEQVIPRMDGTLSGEGFKVDKKSAGKGVVRFTFNTPYARRLYFHPEYHFHHAPWSDSRGNHDGNPNAQGEWMVHWMEGGKYEDRPAEIFAETLKRFI